MLRGGKPAVAVVTEAFANLAITAAGARGVAPLPMLVLPHPMETRLAEEIDLIAEDRFDELIGCLVALPSGRRKTEG